MALGRRAFMAVAVAAILTASACAGIEAAADPTPSTNGLDTLRTDPDPIATRYPGLGEFTDVHWIAWYRTDPRVPGPNAFDLQALVVLSPEAAAAAKTDYVWAYAPADVDATMRDELRPYSPSEGDWRHNEQYERDIAAEGFGATVYLDFASGTVYLQTVLE